MRHTGAEIDYAKDRLPLNIPDRDGALIASEYKQDEIDVTKRQSEALESRGPRQLDKQSGKIGWALLWLLGVPLPLLLIAYLIWGR